MGQGPGRPLACLALRRLWLRKGASQGRSESSFSTTGHRGLCRYASLDRRRLRLSPLARDQRLCSSWLEPLFDERAHQRMRLCDSRRPGKSIGRQQAPSSRVLNVGAGTEAFTVHVLATTEARVTASDVHQSILDSIVVPPKGTFHIWVTAC